MHKGAPKGNNNAGRGRQASKALEYALKNDGDISKCIGEIKALAEIWGVMIGKAKDGDGQAANMIMDRLEGKPGQSIMLTGDEDNPVAIKEVVRTIVKPNDTDG